jgi:hypothetical protein
MPGTVLGVPLSGRFLLVSLDLHLRRRLMLIPEMPAQAEVPEKAF